MTYRMASAIIAPLLVAAALFGASGGYVAADQAPFWESPVGLTPGHPDARVRMASETVDIQVVERPDGVFAVVDATFSMLNEGPDIRMKVGFPNWVADLFKEFSPVVFTPANLQEFRVRSRGVEYAVTEEKVELGRWGGGPWLLWEMDYPSGRLVDVRVSYEQTLTRPSWDGTYVQPYVLPMYVLRTGALWAGTIGQATITMTAPSGGAFLGGPELAAYNRKLIGRLDEDELEDRYTLTWPSLREVIGADRATERSETRLVWRMRDFEPDRDVGTTYILRDAWTGLRDGEAAVATGTASADAYVRAARAALRVLVWMGRTLGPRSLVERYAAPARAWAWAAAMLDPEHAGAWEAVGDVERWWAGSERFLQCWPTRGAAAYRRAIELGSPTASQRLEEMFATAEWQFGFLPYVGEYGGEFESCDGSPDPEVTVLPIRGAVMGGNYAWQSAVGWRGSTGGLKRYFGGDWLQMVTEEVGTLRESGMYREALLRRLSFRSIDVTGPDSAVVETTEDWDDKTYRSDRTVAGDASGRLHKRYELRLLDGEGSCLPPGCSLWKIVGVTITREG